MLQWICDKLGIGDEFATIYAKTIGDLRAELMQYTRECGHPGYLVELFLLRDGKEPVRCGCLAGDQLQHATMLLQWLAEYVGDQEGVRQLPTVPLDGRMYFVDDRLGELRNVNDIGDRFLLTKVE
jgi:hypothetical protein